MSDLLPCPFCGSPADFDQWIGEHPLFENKWSVVCNGDGCRGTTGQYIHARRVEAAAAWNRRQARAIKAWAVCPREGLVPCRVYKTRQEARNWALDWQPPFSVVRVLIQPIAHKEKPRV